MVRLHRWDEGADIALHLVWAEAGEEEAGIPAVVVTEAAHTRPPAHARGLDHHYPDVAQLHENAHIPTRDPIHHHLAVEEADHHQDHQEVEEQQLEGLGAGDVVRVIARTVDREVGLEV